MCRIFWNSRLLMGSSRIQIQRKGPAWDFKQKLKASIWLGVWKKQAAVRVCWTCSVFIPFPNISTDEHSLGRRWVG